MKCPRCGKKMDLCKKDTSSGRDSRTYEWWPCNKWVDRGNGIALWQVLHEVRERISE